MLNYFYHMCCVSYMSYLSYMSYVSYIHIVNYMTNISYESLSLSYEYEYFMNRLKSLETIHCLYCLKYNFKKKN